MKVEEIKKGEGAVVEEKGEKKAVYRRKNGEVVRLSPSCTHLGCMVEWDDEKKGWDCPCHGSFFSAEGKVEEGPAKKDLEHG